MNRTQNVVRTTSETPRDVNSHPPSRRAADDGRWWSANVLGKRQRYSGPLDEDLRRRDDDNTLEEEYVTVHQVPGKRTCIAQPLGAENMVQYLEAMGKHIQSLQVEVQALHLRIAELESDSAESNTESVTRRQYLCPISHCGKSFFRYEHLRRHIKDEGSQAHKDFASSLDRTFCELCEKPFKRPEDYTRHEKRYHIEIFELRHAWTNSAPPPPTDEEATAADVTQSIPMESSRNVEESSPTQIQPHSPDRLVVSLNGCVNDRIVLTESQANFLGIPGDGSEGSSVRHAPEERFTAYSYWPGETAGQISQNPIQQLDCETSPTHDFTNWQLRNPLEERFTSYSYWPGETFGETQDQSRRDLREQQVRIPLQERFTSYWRGGTADDNHQNESQQSIYGLSNAHDVGDEMSRTPLERRTTAHSLWPLSRNPFENSIFQAGWGGNEFVAATQKPYPISYQEISTCNPVR